MMKKIALVLFILGMRVGVCFADYVPRTYAEKGSVECALQCCGDGGFAQDLYQLPCCGTDKYLCFLCLKGTEVSLAENLRNHEEGYRFAVQECKENFISFLKLPDKYWKKITLNLFITCPFCRGYIFTKSITTIPKEYRLKHCLRKVVWKNLK